MEPQLRRRTVHGVLINRRKLYAAELRNAVAHNHLVRLRADYEDVAVSQTQASRAVRRTRDVVRAVEARGQPAP